MEAIERILPSVYRLSAIRWISSFRTVYDEAVLVLAKIVPIDILVDEISRIYLRRLAYPGQILTYLDGHNNPINGFRSAVKHRSAPLFLAHLRQFVTPIDDRTSSIWSFEGIQGRPLRRLSQISALNTHLAGASSSI